MLKMFAAIVAVVSMAAAITPAEAGLMLANGLSTNGLSTNGLSTSGLMLGNGTMLNGPQLTTTTLHPVRIALPGGTELTFR
jgi:hypothetical protein